MAAELSESEGRRQNLLHTLHGLAGRPTPDWTGKARTARPAPPTRPGVCALTGERTEVVDLQHGVSATFTTWDRFPYRTAAPAGLSIPACWALRLRIGMQQPHAVLYGPRAPPG